MTITAILDTPGVICVCRQPRRGGGDVTELAELGPGSPRNYRSRSTTVRAWRAGTRPRLVRADRRGSMVVREFAVRLALAAGSKCFYTTPLKALEQQSTLISQHVTVRPDRADR